MKGATTQDTPAERNKKYCKNWQAKQKEKWVQYFLSVSNYNEFLF